VSTPATPAARARVAFALIAREVSDSARGTINLLDGTASTPAERLRAAREPRRQALHLLDLWVIVERLDYGSSWAAIGEGLGISADMARDRYDSTVEAWNDPTDSTSSDYLGLLAPGALDETAATLDGWWDRHSEPWDHVSGVVTRALA
jgi:hypothetical protein